MEIQKKEIQMRRILYNTPILKVPCPYNKQLNTGYMTNPLLINVGSAFCHECKNFVSDNKTDKPLTNFIVCKGDEEE